MNRTPDSVFDRGRTYALATALDRVDQVIGEGPAIIDIGGVKAAPGDAVSAEQEAERVIEMVKLVRERHPDTVISVDTYRLGRRARLPGGSRPAQRRAGRMGATTGRGGGWYDVGLVPTVIRVMSIAPGIMATPAFRQSLEEVERTFSDQLLFPRRLGLPRSSPIWSRRSAATTISTARSYDGAAASGSPLGTRKPRVSASATFVNHAPLNQRRRGIEVERWYLVARVWY